MSQNNNNRVETNVIDLKTSSPASDKEFHIGYNSINSHISNGGDNMSLDNERLKKLEEDMVNTRVTIATLETKIDSLPEKMDLLITAKNSELKSEINSTLHQNNVAMIKWTIGTAFSIVALTVALIKLI